MLVKTQKLNHLKCNILHCEPPLEYVCHQASTSCFAFKNEVTHSMCKVPGESCYTASENQVLRLHALSVKNSQLNTHKGY